MSHRITINGVPIEWSESGQRFTFFGIEAILFWKDPSLLSLLKPLREELGGELFALLLAFEVSRGTYDDYYQMVEHLGGSFEEGFTNWGEAVSGAGWGAFHLEAMDWSSQTARVLVERPWELQLFPDAPDEVAVPFIDGKISGIFSWAFGTNCRARLLQRGETQDGPWVRLEARPNSTTLAHELDKLQQRRGASHEELLQATNRSLREHLDRFFDALSATGEFVWEMDANTVLQFATDPLSRLLQRNPAELEGTRLDDHLTEGARPTLNRHLTNGSRTTQSGRQVELDLVGADGAVHTVSAGIRPVLDLDGHVIGYRGAGRDVTQEKAQERELSLYRANLETAVQRRTEELERFTEATAHHLQEPLRRIGAFASRLEHRYGPAEGENRDPDVARIQAGVAQMSELLQGLQRYLALDAGDVQPVPIPSDAALRRAWADVSPEAEVAGAVLEPHPGLPTVAADPQQLRELFRLLLANSLTYTREGVTPCIRVSAEREGEQWLFRIRDNGQGIEPAYRERVFRMFERLSPGDGTEGSGIGLPMARKIVEAHGGHIRIEDPAEGEPGITVAFALPAADPSGTATEGNKV